MAQDVFISYSQNDKETVDTVCQALEQAGFSCWYAPRNVPCGEDWDESILEALAASRVMILIWSTKSDQSKQVKREVALALDEMGVTVIPFRIESIEPSRLRYYLSGIQWLDATKPPPEANLDRLIEHVKIALPTVGQLLISEEEKLERSRMLKTEARQAEKTNDDDEETRLLSQVEVLQEAEAKAIQEVEAAAYRHSRLRAEVAALQRADAATLPPCEAEVLRRAVEADAECYAEEKAHHLARVEFLHQAAQATRDRAEHELRANGDEGNTAVTTEANYKKED